MLCSVVLLCDNIVLLFFAQYYRMDTSKTFYCVRTYYYEERQCYHFRTKAKAEIEYRILMIQMLWHGRMKKEYLESLTNEQLIEQLGKNDHSAVDLEEIHFSD